MPVVILVNVARGGLMADMRPAIQLVMVVAIPAPSRARASSPTDCTHNGHDGTKKAACTRSSWATATIAGMVSSMMRRTSG